MSIPLHTRQKLREASHDQPGATRYGPSTIARYQQIVENRDREIVFWKCGFVALLMVIFAQWWGGR